MERLIVLPPVKNRVRMALLHLADYKDIPTDQLMQMARQLPGGSRVYLPDRVTTIAFLLGNRLVELNWCGRRASSATLLTSSSVH
jgi:hypothetical protein